MNIGTDINNEWVFEDGDLSLIDGEKNLIQSISNRLNTVYDESLYYSNYGGYLQQFIGWKKTEETRQLSKKYNKCSKALISTGYFQ